MDADEIKTAGHEMRAARNALFEAQIRLILAESTWDAVTMSDEDWAKLLRGEK